MNRVKLRSKQGHADEDEQMEAKDALPRPCTERRKARPCPISRDESAWTPRPFPNRRPEIYRVTAGALIYSAPTLVAGEPKNPDQRPENGRSRGWLSSGDGPTILRHYPTRIGSLRCPRDMSLRCSREESSFICLVGGHWGWGRHAAEGCHCPVVKLGWKKRERN